jgi:predicted DNA-binding transcriptional regulator AlpA
MREQVSAQPSPSLNDRRPKSRIIKLPAVMARTGFSKSKIFRDVKTGKFPQQAKKLEGSTSAGWFEDDIDEFMEARRPKTSHHGNQALPKVAQRGGAEDPDVHNQHPAKLGAASLSKPQAPKVGEDLSLIRTGLKLHGTDVYFHRPTGKLLVMVGSMPDEWRSVLGTIIGLDHNGADEGRAGRQRGI